MILILFDRDKPETKIMAITGPRGCGKTVLLSSLIKYYDEKKDWIIVQANPNNDILEQMASKIYESGKLKKLFLMAEFNFSFNGIGFSIKGQEPVSSIYVLIEKMLEYLKGKKTNVLITIDDISTNDYVKKFASYYQCFISDGYLVYFLTTGLYENLNKLEKVDNLTFLSRAPKIYLERLNLKAITFSYMNIFNLNEDEAIKIAKPHLGQ